MALLVFEDVRASPLADLMDVAQRQKTASELNAAILASQSQVGRVLLTRRLFPLSVESGDVVALPRADQPSVSQGELLWPGHFSNSPHACQSCCSCATNSRVCLPPILFVALAA